LRPPPPPPLPYTTLFRSVPANNALSRVDLHRILAAAADAAGAKVAFGLSVQDLVDTGEAVEVTLTDGRTDTYDLVVGFDGIRSPDRKSTRLNSSHVKISY